MPLSIIKACIHPYRIPNNQWYLSAHKLYEYTAYSHVCIHIQWDFDNEMWERIHFSIHTIILWVQSSVNRNGKRAKLYIHLTNTENTHRLDGQSQACKSGRVRVLPRNQNLLFAVEQLACKQYRVYSIGKHENKWFATNLTMSVSVWVCKHVVHIYFNWIGSGATPFDLWTIIMITWSNDVDRKAFQEPHAVLEMCKSNI